MDPIKEYLMDEKKLAIFAGALIIGLIVRILKDDTKGPTIDKRWRMLLVWVLGVCQMGLNLAIHMTWKQAAEYAAISALLAISGHETIIEWWRGGKELPLPGLMKPENDNSTPILKSVDPPENEDEDPPAAA